MLSPELPCPSSRWVPGCLRQCMKLPVSGPGPLPALAPGSGRAEGALQREEGRGLCSGDSPPYPPRVLHLPGREEYVREVTKSSMQLTL